MAIIVVQILARDHQPKSTSSQNEPSPAWTGLSFHSSRPPQSERPSPDPEKILHSLPLFVAPLTITLDPSGARSFSNPCWMELSELFMASLALTWVFPVIPAQWSVNLPSSLASCPIKPGFCSVRQIHLNMNFREVMGSQCHSFEPR